MDPVFFGVVFLLNKDVFTAFATLFTVFFIEFTAEFIEFIEFLPLFPLPILNKGGAGDRNVFIYLLLGC
jgi:hypothetical protein